MFVWKFGYTPYTLFLVFSFRCSVCRKKSGNLRLPLLIFLSLDFGLSVGLIYFFVGKFFYCVDWTSFSH